MKRLFLLTAILAVFGLSSCEKAPLNPILGTWEAVSIDANINGVTMTLDMADTGIEMVFTFNEDGTGSAYMQSEAGREDAQFEYNLVENVLNMTMDGVTDKIPVTIDKTEMTMEVNGELIGEESAKLILHFRKI